ncbi:MAG TPA: creatininase family protein [Bacteroidales bacterium]|nr:creatininase family protein [Bacteroidales bacterium]
METFILAQSHYKELKDKQTDLAVLPWGATEAHNYHLPYATDNIMVEKITEAAAKKATEKGGKILVLPAIPFGVNTGQLDIRVNINLNPSTQLAILNDIADVLDRHNIHKFLILNGHGGNDFKQMIRELGFRFPKLFICSCNWYQAVDASLFEEGGGHADEMETSMMQYLVPELVLPLSEAGEGKGRKFRIKALNGKWAWAERKWSQVTSDTGIGNPQKATPEKGKKCFDDVVTKIGDFMYDLCIADINNLYE